MPPIFRRPHYGAAATGSAVPKRRMRHARGAVKLRHKPISDSEIDIRPQLGRLKVRPKQRLHFKGRSG